MNFEKERYVRVYTRDTPTTKLIGWDGRAVLWELMRKVDREGRVDLDGLDQVEAICALTDMPAEVVRSGLQKLLARGTVEIDAGGLVLPKFRRAQEWVSGEVMRARKYRERQKERAAEEPPPEPPPSRRNEAPAPESDASRCGVTERDEARRSSRTVTPSLSIPIHPFKKEMSVSTDSEPPPAVSGVFSLQPSTAKARDPAVAQFHADVRTVFAFWVERRALVIPGARAPTLDAKRRAKITARLREGYSVDDLRAAIDGMLQSQFNVEQGHTDVELACRDQKHVDMYIERDRQARAMVAEAAQ